MVTNRIIFFATSVQPNPEEIDYWVDLSDNPYGGSIKYFNGTEWVRLAASGGTPDLNNYYTKTQINNLLNNKADVGDVDSKVDDEEVKDVIKDIQFNTSNPNNITMVMFKYDGSNKTVSIPVASTSSAGIITSKDFLDFVKQHQLQELHTEMIDTFADIRAKYQKKLIAGLNIEIDQKTNVISASGDLAAQWDNITGKPDFKPVATSGDYNDLINKLKPGKDVSISEDNVISIAIDSDSLEQSLATLQSNIDKEAATARAAETKLGNDIATEKNRAQSAEQTISTNLQNEIDRSTQIDTQHTNAINKEVQDRKEAIATEVSDRNAAILVETNRAKAKEEELDNKITDHTAATNAALALKADKSDTYTKAQVDTKLSGAYKVKGSSTFEALPKDNNVVGDVYNITNAFNLGGKHYDAGTNVVWTEDGWDALSGSFDTTAIEGSIQEVADDLAQEILDRTQADTTINNNVSSLSNRVKVNEDKLTIINGNESTTGSIANAIKQAKSYTDTTVTAEQTRAEKAEQKLTSDLASEVTRAKGAESANATAIANEVERATGVEETLNSNITQLQAQKVDKVEGKGLSTNDYTTPEKNKLAAIEAEANKYVLPAATASALGGVKIGSNITLANGGTISITKANVTSALGVDPTTKYVTLDTAQTITGQKTFSKDVIFNNTLTGIYNAGGNLIFGVGTEKIACLLADYFGPVEARTNTINLGNKDGYWKGVHAGRLISYTTDGTAPIQVASTTLCTNLNADMVDGFNVSDGENTGIHYTKYYPKGDNSVRWIKLATLPLKSDEISSGKYIMFEIVGGGDYGSYQYCYSTLIASTRNIEYVKLVKQQSSIYNGGDQFVAGYVVTSANVEIWLGQNTSYSTSLCITCKNKNLATNVLTASPVNTQPQNFVLGEIVTLDAPDWYGVSWSETSSNPDCTRIGNMDMHRTLPIQSMMKGYLYFKDGNPLRRMLKLNDSWTKCENYSAGGWRDVDTLLEDNNINVMIKIPEFWWIDDYTESTETHNLKICPHAKPGWYHHKEAYVSAYEGYIDGNYYRSSKNKIPSVNFTRSAVRPKARANGLGNSWNIYTYNEHRAICHLFLVEYATRNSQKAVNTALTVEGFRQGGLGSGCTTGMVTINGATTYSFIPTGSSDSLGSGSGEVTVTIQQTDSSGSNTTTTTRKCNRYRGIENPFGHVWKHTDDVISVYISGYGARFWYKCDSPDHFGDSISNDNPYYKNIAANAVVTGYKTKIVTTSTCDFFALSCNNGSETTYWCDYNWDNTDTSEHCLLIGSYSDNGGQAGLFYLSSSSGVGYFAAAVGSRLTYLPWAE